MKPLRIAVWHNLPSGGGKRALHDHVRGLIARGHTVESWCPASADTAFLPLPNEHVLPWNDPSPQPWPFYAARVEAARLDARMALMQEHCRTAAAAMNTFDVAIIHPCQFFAAVPLGSYLTIPKLLYLQEPYRPLYEAFPEPAFEAPAPPGKSRLAPWFLKQRLHDAFLTPARRRQVRYEVNAARSVDRILVNSYFSRENVKRAYGLNSHVCYLGIDSSRFHSPPSMAKTESYLLGLGGVTQNKNIAFVIDAVALVPSKPKLVWIGNLEHTPYRHAMEEHAKARGVDLEIRVRVSDDELHTALATATMLLAAPTLEPFGFAPLEANAAGTPVVAIAEGGLRETIRHEVNGLVTDPDPAAFAAAIVRLLNDPPLARRLGERGSQIVKEEWSLSAAIDRLESHIDAVVPR